MFEFDYIEAGYNGLYRIHWFASTTKNRDIKNFAIYDRASTPPQVENTARISGCRLAEEVFRKQFDNDRSFSLVNSQDARTKSIGFLDVITGTTDYRPVLDSLLIRDDIDAVIATGWDRLARGEDVMSDIENKFILANKWLGVVSKKEDDIFAARLVDLVLQVYDSTH